LHDKQFKKVSGPGLIPKFCIARSLPEKGGGRKLRIQRDSREGMVKRLNGVLILSQSILAFPEPIIRVRGEGRAWVQFEKQAKACSRCIVMLPRHLSHDTIVELTAWIVGPSGCTAHHSFERMQPIILGNLYMTTVLFMRFRDRKRGWNSTQSQP